MAKEKELTDAELESRAAERMTELGFDPLADEVTPEGQPIPDEDMEEIDEDDDTSIDDGNDDDTGSEAEEEADSTPEEEEDDDNTEGEEGATDEDAQKTSKKKDEVPELSDAYYRAAIHSGMTEDDVVDFMAANPDLAIKTFANLHENMNRASNEFSEMGRIKKAQAEKPAEEPAKTTFKKLDLTKLRDENPDNEALIDIMEQMQTQNEGLATQITDLNKAPARSADNVARDRNTLEEEKIAHTAKQIEEFFGDPTLKSYEQHYGVVPAGSRDWSMLLPAERMNRVAVIEQVEQLIEGAKAIGKDISVPEALSRAHLVTMQPVQAKMIRADIMEKVLKKSKGITFKPTGKAKSSANSTGDKKPKTIKDVENKAEARMKKIGMMKG